MRRETKEKGRRGRKQFKPLDGSRDEALVHSKYYVRTHGSLSVATVSSSVLQLEPKPFWLRQESCQCRVASDRGLRGAVVTSSVFKD